MRQNKLFLFLLSVCFSVGITAQTAATSLPYSTGFEDATDNASWQFANATVNQWCIGSAANHGGTNALYISSDGGTSCKYNNSKKTTSFAYRTFHFDASDYSISFDWTGQGESTYDGVQVLLIPSSVSLSSLGADNNNITLGSITGFTISTMTSTITQAGYIRLDCSRPYTTNKQWIFSEQDEWVAQSQKVTISAAGDYNLVFIFQCDNGTGRTAPAIDNIFISKMACVEMAAPAVSDITANSAKVTWTASTSTDVQGYDYIVIPASGSIDESKVQHAATQTQASVTGLSANTDYVAYVRAVCEEGAGVWARTAFHTDCAPISVPFAEGFEGTMPAGDKVMPYCWEAIKNSGYPYVYEPSYSSVAHNGEKSLIFMGGSSGSENYAILPTFSVPVNELMLSFYYKSGYVQDGYGKFIVGVMSNPADKNTFVAIDTLEQKGSWTLAKVYLNDAPATHNYIAIKYGCADKASGNSYIDDITVDNMPACVPAKKIRINATTQTSATIAWQAGKDETDWIVKYVAAGETDTVTSNVSATPSLTINGLKHSTSYSYYVAVQSDCGSEKAEVTKATLSFATECAAFTAVRDSILLDFETYRNGQSFADIPCWNTFAGKGTTTTWKVESGSASLSNLYDNTNYSVLVTPELEIPGNSELSLYVKSSYSSAYTANDSLIVYINADPTLEGATRLGKITGLTSDYQFFRFSLEQFRGNHYVLIVSYNYGAVLVDNILISPEPACLPPTKLVLGDVAARQATFSWTPGKNETRWQIVAVNNSQALYFEETVDNTPAFTMEGLEPATTDTFSITITSVCDDVPSVETLKGTLIFTTICEPADHTAAAPGDTLLFTSFEADDKNEAFEDGPWDDNAHICWTNIRHGGGNGNDYLRWSVGNGSRYDTYSGEQSLSLSAPSSNTHPGILFALPAMTFSEGQELGLSFWAKCGSSLDSIVVYLNSMPSVEGATHIGNTGILTSDMTYYEFDPIRTTAGVNYVIVYTERSASSEMYLDDLTLRLLPNCRKVKEAEITDIATTGAKLAWTPAHEENTWNVVVKNGKDTLLNTQAITPSVPLSNLTPATKYTFSVTIAAVCDGVEAAEKYEGQLSFTTGCEVITAFPWSEGFEAMPMGNSTSDGPLCWDILDANQGGNASVFVENSYTPSSYGYNPPKAYHSGSKGLVMALTSGSNAAAYALLPDMENVAGKQLVFWYKLYETNKKLEVGYLTDVADKSTWKTIASYTPKTNDTWEEIKVTLAVPEDVVNPHFGFRFAASYSNTAAYIDDIKVREVPVCDMATDLHIIDSLSTANSATVAWSGLADAGYTVIFRGNDTITKQVTDTFCVLDGLTASRIYHYEVSVVARCVAGEAVDTLTANLQWLTDCAGAVTTFPYNIGFEEEDGYAFKSSTVYTMPKCVVSEVCEGASNYRLIPSNSNPNGVHSGSQYLYMYGAFSYSYKYRSSFAFPEMVIPEANAYELAIWSRINSSSKPNYPDSVEVFYNTEKQSLDGATKIGAFKPTTTYTRYKFTLPAAGSQYVILKAWANQGQIFFDDASFRKIPSCFPVENVRVSAVGLDTARIAWDTKNDGASYRVNIMQGTNVLYDGMVNDTVLVLRNLTSSTMYNDLKVTIVTVCTDGEISADIYTGSISFATECRTIINFPWVEDFENFNEGTFSNPCWLNEHISGNGNKLFAIAQGKRDGKDAKFVKLPVQTENTYTRLVLPTMDIPVAGAYDFYLDVHRHSGSNKPTEGVYIIAGTDTLAFIPRQIAVNGINVPIETAEAWYTYHFTIPNAGVQNITILGRSEWGRATNMDNFMVKANGKVPSALSGTGADTDLAIKFIRNGQVYILRNGIIYNALGQRVEVLK